jgi:hypothetical protein
MRYALLAATALLGFSVPYAANALPSIGAGDTMNVVGNATFDGVNVTFAQHANLVTGTGAYVALGTCVSCVTVNTPLEYSPFTNLANLFVAQNNGITATVSLTSQVDPPSVVGNDLSLNDTAVLTLTGFAPTAGTLEMTVNQATGVASGSFSSTVQGVPAGEPLGLAVLGVGLLGLGMVRARGR